MNETAQPVLEEHVNLLRLDQLGYFSYAEGLMSHALPGAVCVRSVIRRGGFPGFVRCCSRTQFERANGTAFRTANPCDLASFGY